MSINESTSDAVPVLTVDDVSVRFGGVQAVAHATIHAYAGEVTGLIGPNGAGKTTTFNIITGLEAPSEAAPNQVPVLTTVLIEATTAGADTGEQR